MQNNPQRHLILVLLVWAMFFFAMSGDTAPLTRFVAGLLAAFVSAYYLAARHKEKKKKDGEDPQ